MRKADNQDGISPNNPEPSEFNDSEFEILDELHSKLQ